jgi:hypothetical protein
MRVTVDDLNRAGADLSTAYLYKISDPSGYNHKSGLLYASWDTDRLKKAIESKSNNHLGNENVSTGSRAKFLKNTNRLLRAIAKLEKRDENLRVLVR